MTPDPHFLYAPEATDLILAAGRAMCPAESPEPDVWWGKDGIDAQIWGDGFPYADPCPRVAESLGEPEPEPPKDEQ